MRVRSTSGLRLPVVWVTTFGVLLAAGQVTASECDNPDPSWLFCEDFEQGGLGWAPWFEQSPFTECNGCPDGLNDPARVRLSDAAEDVHDGGWGLLMPGEAAGGYRGASLTYRSCAGEKRAGCTLEGYDRVFYRAWVKLAPEHRYVHHFMSVGGTRPDGYWEGDGNAGCRPNGYRAAGTTVDFSFSDTRQEHELFFYTYFPEMRCDSGGYCDGAYAQGICDGCATKDMACDSGLECCWGNHFAPETKPILPRGEWVCLEMMMQLNTPGEADGEMAFWVNDELGHQQSGMHWRDVAELQLNKVWVQHYIASGDTDQSNVMAWDDIVASTERIGCGSGPLPPVERDDTATGGPADTAAPVDEGVTGDAASGADLVPTPSSGDQGACACDMRSTGHPSGPLVATALVGLLLWTGRRKCA